MQIESKLHDRQGKAVTNFEQALTAPGSDLARQTLKDPYVFNFLGLADDAKERDIERAMTRHLKDTLVKLGVGRLGGFVRDTEVDGPTIGLLLCRTKNRVVAEYALRDIDKAIGVADVQLTRLLPDRLEGSLPTVEALEAELADLSEPTPPEDGEAGADQA